MVYKMRSNLMFIDRRMENFLSIQSTDYNSTIKMIRKNASAKIQ